MIRRLTLENWRSYEHAVITFEPGTTFVVAPNGVGKTSLIEAARWALFGKILSDDHAAIRLGADTALAIVDLELPDKRILSIERPLTRTRRVPPTAHLDGTKLTEEALHRLLSDAYRTGHSFLAGLTMPAPDRGNDRPSALGLEDHLCQYYGVDGLRKAIDQLEEIRKTTEARIRRTKAANSTSARRLSELQSSVAVTARQVVDATNAHEILQNRLERARERERFEIEHQRWQDSSAARNQAVGEIAARISVELGDLVDEQNLAEALERHINNVETRLAAIRVDVGVNKGTAAALAANEERLDAAHDACPVCRRPLDDTTIASAHAANMRELAALRDAIKGLKEAETHLVSQRTRLKSAQTELRRIPQLAGQPRPPAAEIDETTPSAQLKSLEKDAIEVVVAARANHVKATEAFDEAQAADEAMRELESLFAQEARATVAIEATKATLAELLEGTIRPLAAEVSERWKALFPGRGPLTTHPTGDITRTVNEHLLPFDSFSTGESMGATILLRLLVAQMATTADFCWFDEPLEHLDPDVRRRVANVLSHATSGEHRLRQIVVTTYEEPLARQLHVRDAQHVNLIDVRQAS